MDISDQATAHEERCRDASLAAQRAQAQAQRLPPRGACYYCEAALDGERRFCDAECRDGFEQLQTARRRNGK